MPQPLRRNPNWASALTRYLLEMKRLSKKGELKFDWEHVNCGWFVSNAVHEMTGQSLYEPFEDVDSNLAAAKVLAQMGHSSLEQYLDTLAPTKDLMHVQRGDVVLLSGISEEGLVMGLADPPFYWATGVEGLVSGPLFPSTHDPNSGVYKVYAVG